MSFSMILKFWFQLNVRNIFTISEIFIFSFQNLNKTTCVLLHTKFLYANIFIADGSCKTIFFIIHVLRGTACKHNTTT